MMVWKTHGPFGLVIAESDFIYDPGPKNRADPIDSIMSEKRIKSDSQQWVGSV